MTKEAPSKKQNAMYGWQAALVACGLLLIDLMLGGFVGALFSVTSTIVILIAIVTGIVNLAKRKRSDNPGLTVAMSIIAGVVYCLLLSAIGGSTQS